MIDIACKRAAKTMDEENAPDVLSFTCSMTNPYRLKDAGYLECSNGGEKAVAEPKGRWFTHPKND